jgi:carbon-monoxide dehydrogenase small subunit
MDRAQEQALYVPLTLQVNGRSVTLHVAPWRLLADVLRDDLGLTGLKVACGSGECGSCTVLVDGEAIRSCMMLAPQAHGRTLLTIEGLAAGERLHPLQRAFIEHFAVQCGYCIPGMIMAAKALLDRQPRPTADAVNQALCGNLCRCTGYVYIVDAVLAAARELAGPEDAA